MKVVSFFMVWGAGLLAVALHAQPADSSHGTDDSPATVRPGASVTRAQVDAALRPYAAEPTVRDVQEAVIDYVRAHPERLDSLRARAANRAFAPKLSLRGNLGNDKTNRVFTEPGVAERQADYTSDDWGVQVDTSWELDRTIFDPEEARVVRESVLLQRYRDDIVNEATRRYYERRKLQVEIDLSQNTDVADRVRKELRLQELTADLDALTGGYFSKKLIEKGRDPY